jgi:hypothetical protein
MIYETVDFLARQLQQYFDGFEDDKKLKPPATVLTDNIWALDDTAKSKEDNSLVITMVNITEEATMKNIPSYNMENGAVAYSNPPVFINLFLLFTAKMQLYEQNLRYISHVIRFFQGRSLFTNSVFTDLSADNGNNQELRITVELQSLTLEQVNYIWSTLGGKQSPFVLYKVRLIRLERDSVKETRGVITDIRINT